MTLKRLICCYIVILPVCFGDECHMANYRISFVCDTYNGAALSTHLGIRSVMDCTNMCTNDANCQSVIYDNATESCTTYSYFLSPPSLHCSHQVVYAALETHMASCQSSAAHSNIPSTVTPDSTLGTAAPGASIFSTCTTDTECSTISDAECRHGKCQCVPGLSYDPSSNTCIPDCFGNYGDTFQEALASVVIGFNDKIELNVNDPVLCMAMCVSEASFICRSAEFVLAGGDCYLSVETAATQPQSYISPTASFNYYQRDCAP